MKKILAALLCLALMLNCAAALAETAAKETIGRVDANGVFTLQCAIPEGYSVTSDTDETGNVRATIASEDSRKPLMLISIGFNELYAEVDRLNDLSEEELQFVKSTFAEEDDVAFETAETDYGTKLLVVTAEDEGVVVFVDFYTIYKGYEVEFVLMCGSDEETGSLISLTDEQIRMAIQFLSDMNFVEAEN